MRKRLMVGLAMPMPALLLLSASAQATTFPTPGKSMRPVVPFAASGQNDIRARPQAAKLKVLPEKSNQVDVAVTNQGPHDRRGGVIHKPGIGLD